MALASGSPPSSSKSARTIPEARRGTRQATARPAAHGSRRSPPRPRVEVVAGEEADQDVAALLKRRVEGNLSAVPPLPRRPRRADLQAVLADQLCRGANEDAPAASQRLRSITTGVPAHWPLGASTCRNAGSGGGTPKESKGASQSVPSLARFPVQSSRWVDASGSFSVPGSQGQ